MRKLALMLAGIALFSLSVLAQSTTITGKVVDSKTGLGLPGVTVSAIGSDVGVNTGDDGSYSITIPSSVRTLSFSYVGYTTISRNIGKLSAIDVELSEATTDLSEVVVVGYGTQQ